jgi:hypothetical protein
MPSRESGKHPLTRACLVLCAVICASCLAAASDDGSSSRTCAALDGPTSFDYIVLASMAESPRFLAMAGYHSTATERAELTAGAQLTAAAASSRPSILNCVEHGVTPYGAGPPVLAATPPIPD